MATKLNKKQIKTIEELDRRVSMTREFMNDWLLFNQILSAYPSPGVNKAQLENQFLKIKSKLAREHNVLRESLQADYQIDGNTMNIISSATNLETIYAQSEVAVKKLQGEWHRSFITINETLGSVEDKKARAEAGEKIMLLPAGGLVTQTRSGMSKSTQQGLMIVGLIAGVLAICIAVPPIREFWADIFRQVMGN